MAWAGSGDLSRVNSSFHVKRPGYGASGHFNGSTRDAVATGSVSNGVTDYIGGDPAYRAGLEWNRTGLLEITSG